MLVLQQDDQQVHALLKHATSLTPAHRQPPPPPALFSTATPRGIFGARATRVRSLRHEARQGTIPFHRGGDDDCQQRDADIGPQELMLQPRPNPSLGGTRERAKQDEDFAVRVGGVEIAAAVAGSGEEALAHHELLEKLDGILDHLDLRLRYARLAEQHAN
eukprot:761061-Hanusia_phi.AAC.2